MKKILLFFCCLISLVCDAYNFAIYDNCSSVVLTDTARHYSYTYAKNNLSLSRVGSVITLFNTTITGPVVVTTWTGSNVAYIAPTLDSATTLLYSILNHTCTACAGATVGPQGPAGPKGDSGVSNWNIYTSDGSLPSNRKVNLNHDTLSFSGGYQLDTNKSFTITNRKGDEGTLFQNQFGADGGNKVGINMWHKLHLSKGGFSNGSPGIQFAMNNSPDFGDSSLAVIYGFSQDSTRVTYFIVGSNNAFIQELLVSPTYANLINRDSANYEQRIFNLNTNKGLHNHIDTSTFSIGGFIDNYWTFQVSVANHTLSYKDGNQGIGKVLTSDANGVGTWQSLSCCNLFDTITTKGIISARDTPTAIVKHGAGTGASVAVYGSDMAMQVQFTTGTSPALNDTVIDIHFSRNYSSVGIVGMTNNGNTNIANLYVQNGYNHIYIRSNTIAALAPNTGYSINLQIIRVRP